ncbi:MAG: GCN5-related N-acetyltransferase like domain, partial [Pseudonocardiales bacterium]|nr:GCN5-related N-acetyltransferase like domain [Pseudonocardiales bacterium]
GADAAGDPDPVAALRTLCAVHWGAGGGQARVHGRDPAAARALGTLGLAPAGGADRRATGSVG